MAPNLKILSIILLATTTITCGKHIKKSEKRGLADFGSGFSSTRLDGSGIKISTDFGKELTLEEFKENGYKFGNDNNDNIGKELGTNFNFENTKYGFGDNINFDSFNFAKQFENNFNFGSSFGTLNNAKNAEQPQNVENVKVQSNNEQVEKENESSQSSKVNLENNNGESSSLSYVTQKNSVSIPQPYQFSINQPAFVPIPQSIPGNIPKYVGAQVPQPYYVHINQPNLVNIPYSVSQGQETFAPAPKSFPIQEHNTNSVPQSVYTHLAEENINNQDNYDKASFGEQSSDQHKYSEQLNSSVPVNNYQSTLQNSNQINSHESESTANKGFIPMVGSYGNNDYLKIPPIYVGPNKIQNNEQLSQADYVKKLESDKIRLSNQQLFQANYGQNLPSNNNYEFLPDSVKSTNIHSSIPKQTESSQSQYIVIQNISPFNQNQPSLEGYNNQFKSSDAYSSLNNNQQHPVIDSLKDTQQFHNQPTESALYQVVQSAGVHNLAQGTAVVPEENKYNNIAGSRYIPIHQFLLNTGTVREVQHFHPEKNTDEFKM